MFQPNSVIAGRYQVIRLVGQGGMSNLYLCHDRKYNNAIVVIKEMTAAYSDPKEQQMAVELFHREAKLLASLNHRHIPKVYDYFQFAGKYYLSMEFIDGEDLAQKLEASKGPLPENQVLEWGEQMSTVLFYLHKHDPPIVFRDVKPSNIMLTDQGVKLIDFGIARHFDQAKKGDTMRIGSPGYAPPEQYAAQTDPRSDIYALGVTLHHALTGRDPTATQTPFLVPPARNLNPALSEATAAMLARATQLSPEDRYQNILEMKNDIKQILQRGKQSTRVVGAPPPPPGPAVAQALTPGAVPPAAAVAPAVAAVAAVAAAAAAQGATGPAGQAATPAAGQPASNAAAPGGVAPNVATPAKKRRGPGKGILLVALVLLLMGGGLFAAGPTGRQKVMDTLKSWVSSIPRGGGDSSPEDSMRKILLGGDPSALLPLLTNGGLDKLSEDKKALYRLNLLVANIQDPAAPARIVHLFYPADLVGTPAEEGLFRGAARATAAANSSGGVDKKLLIVLPRTFEAGQLDDAIAELTSEKEPEGGQRFLVVDPASESAALGPEQKSLPVFVLGQAEGTAGLSKLEEGKGLDAVFSLDKLEPAKLLWAAAGEPPTGSKAEKVEFNDTSEGMNRLLQRAAAEQATVVVEAGRVAKLQGLAAEGRLLLLGVGADSLPELPPGVKAEAVVLGSPLRETLAGSNSFVFSPSDGLDLAQARVFDAVLLTGLWDKGYSGITVTRAPDGKDSPGLTVRYRWTASGWVPALERDVK